MRLLKGPFLCHLSNQRDRLLSLPGSHLIPLLKTLAPFFMPGQVTEHSLGQVLKDRALLKEPYFCERIRAQVDSFLVCNLQFNFANKAIFFSLADCHPKPPSFFGLVISSIPPYEASFCDLNSPKENYYLSYPQGEELHIAYSSLG